MTEQSISIGCVHVRPRDNLLDGQGICGDRWQNPFYDTRGGRKASTVRL